MTGGNQLLIGLGWPMVILIGTWRVRKTRATPEEAEGTTPTEIHLARGQSVDIAYLTIASLYGLTLFLKDTLTLYDAVILITIYVLYLRRLVRGTYPRAPPGGTLRLHRVVAQHGLDGSSTTPCSSWPPG